MSATKNSPGSASRTLRPMLASAENRLWNSASPQGRVYGKRCSTNASHWYAMSSAVSQAARRSGATISRSSVAGPRI